MKEIKLTFNSNTQNWPEFIFWCISFQPFVCTQNLLNIWYHAMNTVCILTFHRTFYFKSLSLLLNISPNLFCFHSSVFFSFFKNWVIVCMCVCVCALLLSHVWLFVTPWTVAHQASLSMGFPRQEYWSGLPFPLLRDLPDPGIKPMSPASPALWADSLPVEPPGKPKVQLIYNIIYIIYNIVNDI